MANNKYTEEQLAQAKTMYLNYKSVKEIEESTRVSQSAIYYHAKDKWNKEREDSKNEVIKAFTERKKALMTQIASSGLEILADAMVKLKSVDRPLSASEIKSISTIVSELDKIGKLDEGNPTDIIAEIKPATTIEIRELLENSDPFMKGEIEDATFKEISNSDESTSIDSSTSEEGDNSSND